MIVIYHNNRCSKSRLCLELIKKSNTDYKVIEYLKEDLSVNNIKEIVYGLEGEINDIVRTNEKEIKNIKIDFKNKDSIIKFAFILHAYDKDKNKFNLDDEIVSGSMFTHSGQIVDERTKNTIEGAN